MRELKAEVTNRGKLLDDAKAKISQLEIEAENRSDSQQVAQLRTQLDQANKELAERTDYIGAMQEELASGKAKSAGVQTAVRSAENAAAAKMEAERARAAKELERVLKEKAELSEQVGADRKRCACRPPRVTAHACGRHVWPPLVNAMCVATSSDGPRDRPSDRPRGRPGTTRSLTSLRTART